MSGGRLSRWGTPEWGIPTGAVLSPFLWLCAIADIEAHIPAARLVCFADDCSAVVSAPTLEEVQAKMETAMAQYAEYMRRNRISPNPSKTQLVVISAHQGTNAAAPVPVVAEDASAAQAARSTKK